MPRPPQYKPFLLTTTIRNPQRLKSFLAVLSKYDGKILDDTLAEKICGELIRGGLYVPMKISRAVKSKIKKKVPLSDKEVAAALKSNPQNHKEAGFSKGWPSRFDTFFRMAKEFGFVFYANGESIRFSAAGRSLVSSEHPGNEQQLFLNALAKYQSNNPFRRVKNENIPLILLLQVISKLNADKSCSNAGISKLELPLVIYWKDSDANALYRRIVKLRQKYGYTPSTEVVVDICRNEIMQGQDIKRSNKSITRDYPDEFIRKMRLTGLISLRGGGRFVDINKNEQKKVTYLLKHYANYEKYTTEKGYFQHIAKIDKNLVSLVGKSVSTSQRGKLLQKWVDFYCWENIKKEILGLSQKRASQDQILKYLYEPVRLEFLTALAIKANFPEADVRPNYPVDDEGIPTSTAGGYGDQGDIECFEDGIGTLIEVTMSEGGAQTKMEIWPIGRHLEKFRKSSPEAVCYFVAPSIFRDSVRQIEFLREKDDLHIIPKTIAEFVAHLESSNTLRISANQR